MVVDPPSGPHAPLSCSQATRVVDGAALIKLAQRVYWGSPEWLASYGRRAHVESIFGNLRNPSTQNTPRGFCRVMGLINTTLMLAFEVMAANLRLVREWAKRTGENSDPLHEPLALTSVQLTVAFRSLTSRHSISRRDRWSLLRGVVLD